MVIGRWVKFRAASRLSAPSPTVTVGVTYGRRTPAVDIGSGDDRVEGNLGADVASLGARADTFTWDIGEGNDTVEGDSGSDVLVFSGSDAPERFGDTANGSRVRCTRRIFTLDLDSIETARVRTRGDSDTVSVGDLTGTDHQGRQGLRLARTS